MLKLRTVPLDWPMHADERSTGIWTLHAVGTRTTSSASRLSESPRADIQRVTGPGVVGCAAIRAWGKNGDAKLP